jgi:hypothetical protein
LETVLTPHQESTPQPSTQSQPEQSQAPSSPPKEDFQSAKFAELAKKERELRQRTLEIEKQKSSIPKREDLLLEAKQDFLKQFKQNPAEVARNMGVSVKELLEYMSKGESIPEKKTELNPDEIRQQVLEELRAEMQAEKEKESQASKEKELLTGWEKEKSDFLDQNADKFFLLADIPETRATIDRILESHYQETGDVLSLEEVSQRAQSAIAEELQAMLKSDRVRNWLSSILSTETPNIETPTESQTLTNDFTPDKPPVNRFMSDEESKKRAAEILRWT